MTEIPNNNDKVKILPVRKALLIIAVATLVISGSFYSVILYLQHLRENQRSDPAYDIVALVQTSPHVQGIKTSYLAELLNLSIDRPSNLFEFSSNDATRKLMESPVIKSAKVRKIRPGTVHVDYELRKPVAYFGDYINMAIDADGIIFPFTPFYTPKHLPEIRLGYGSAISLNGVNTLNWGDVVENEAKVLAFTLLEEVPKAFDAGTILVGIDVSNAFAPGDGQREIILRIEDRMTKVVGSKSVQCIYPVIVRLSPETYRQQLEHFRKLGAYLKVRGKNDAMQPQGPVWRSKTMIVDMRLSELAFFSEEP